MKDSRRAINSSQIKMRAYEVRSVAGTNAASCAFGSVSVADNTLTFASAHGFSSADRIQIATDDTLPTGLAASTDYYVIVVSALVVKLATSRANALAGTAIDITAQGAGNHTITATDKLSGPARLNCSIQAHAVGTYRVSFNQAFASADDIVAIVVADTADRVARIKTYNKSYIDVEIQELDETAAVLDGFFSVMIFGSDTSSRWL